MTTSMTTSIEVPPVGDYQLDPHESVISFRTRHLFGLAPVRGTFGLREGCVQVTDPVQGSSARAVLGAASVDTGNPTRDGALCSAGYLDAVEHPSITFVSTSLAELDGQWLLCGSLTVRGQARPVELRIERVALAGGQLLLRASTEIDRYAFGIRKMPGMAGRRLMFTLDLHARRR